jgi:hypothetical protein
MKVIMFSSRNVFEERSNSIWMIIQGSYSTPKVICVILYEFDGFTFFAKINNYIV